jgi:LEA14-like dessication related protein
LETIDKLMSFVIMGACIAIALGLVVSVGYTTTPSADIATLHSAITSVALKPGSKVIVSVYVPKATSITISGLTLTVTGSSIPMGYVKAMDKAVGLVSSVTESSIVYKVRLSDLNLVGGLTYTLSVECSDVNSVTIKVLSYR